MAFPTRFRNSFLTASYAGRTSRVNTVPGVEPTVGKVLNNRYHYALPNMKLLGIYESSNCNRTGVEYGSSSGGRVESQRCWRDVNYSPADADTDHVDVVERGPPGVLQ